MRILRHLLAGIGVFTVAAAGSFALSSWTGDYALEAAGQPQR